MTAPVDLANIELETKDSGVTPKEMTSLASASLANGVASALGSVASFGLTVLAAHRLGATRAGLYFQGVAVTTIVAAVCTFGAESGAMRQLSRARALGRKVDIRPTIAGAVVPVMVVAVVAGVGVELAAPALGHAFSSTQAASVIRALRILGLLLPFVAGERVLTAAMRGLGVNTPTAAIDGIGQPVLCLLTGGVVAVVSPSLVSFTIAWGVPSVVAAVVACVWLRRVLPERAGPASSWWRGIEHRRQLAVDFWKFTWARGLAQIFQVGTVWIVVVLMGLLGPTRNAGIYGAVSRVAIIGSLVLQSINLVLAPMIPAALATDDREGAQRLYQVATGWAVASGFPIYIMLALFPGTFVALFGQRFAAGSTALSVLCLAMLWNLATGPVTVVLVMAGRSRWNLYNAAATLVVCGGAAAVLIPRYGVTGGALSWGAAILVENGLPLIEVRWLMGLQPFSRATTFAAAGALATFGGFGLAVRLAGYRGFAGAFVAGLLGLTAYLLLMRSGSIHLETGYVTQALVSSVRRSRGVVWDRQLPVVSPGRGLRPLGIVILSVSAAACVVAASSVGLKHNHAGIVAVATPRRSAPIETVPTTAPPQVVDTTTRYSVVGNQILDQAGNPFVPYGIVVDGLSYRDWFRHESEDLNAIKATATAWHGNVVRLQIDPAALLRTDPYDGDMLRQIDAEILAVEQYHMEVILNLKNENDYTPLPSPLPDEQVSRFWSFIAPRYMNDGHVWFDLFNEPRVRATADQSQVGKVQVSGGDSVLQLASQLQAWKVWHDGGYGFVGMQQLVDAIRGSGAKNIIIAETIQSASTLSGIIPLRGSGLVYAIHPYFHPNERSSNWPLTFGEVSRYEPVLVDDWSEYASARSLCTPGAPSLVPQFLAYLRGHGIGLIASGIASPGTLVTQAQDYVHPTSFDPSKPYLCVGLPTSDPPQGAGQLIMNYFAQYSQPPPK
jgi:O-antigen/teichoic acid export membrane protein